MKDLQITELAVRIAIALGAQHEPKNITLIESEIADYVSNFVEARVIQHTENFNNWLDKYFISDGSYYCYKTKSGHKLFTLKELYKKFEQAYHEKPSVSA